MKGLLSRYHPLYIRTLIYMMQANEYYPREFLAWYHRTFDFSAIEKRKHLVYTPKAVLLILFAWGSFVFSAGMSAYVAFETGVPGVISAIIGILFAPFLVPYSLFVLMLFLNALQIPVEWYIVARAKRVLKKHPAVKIAVAGSYGKTTMREILKSVLSSGKRVAAPGGSHNTPLGIAKFVEQLRGDEEVLIFEFGEYYPGDIMRLCKFVEPQWGVITGINEAHLERFKTVDRAAATIFELARYLKDKPVYVNADNELVRAHAATTHIRYDAHGAGDWQVVAAETGIEGTSIDFKHDEAVLRARSKLLGLHNVGPIAAAADIASKLGLTDEQIRLGIERTKPFDHRLQPRLDGGVVMIDDSYNGNPDGARVAIEFLRTLQGRRRWYVTPGLVEMGSRKQEVHETIGRELAQAHIEKVVLLRNSVTPYIAKGLQESDYKGEIVWFDEALAAYRALPTMTVSGDVVLIQNDWPDQYF
ncbi:MAG: UDP-N-acetylmuramoyl-tripeptide--D-alanyl-D-alanine ligase [Candidatus Pacebacteria bacterium]|nr:UDP-N-acetylmuramoyl-tripeptide--D-alanyl-D-alanine ligase [Candidatus Paceibacterota bacterium]